MFADAKVLVAPKAKAANKKSEIIIKGVKDLAELDSYIKTLEAKRTTLRGRVDALVKEQFIEIGEKTHKRPDNFRAVDDTAEASCEFRKRSTRSVLNETEVAALEADGVPFEVLTDVEDTYVINPKYAEDSKLLNKIEKALKGVKELPKDFILKQEGQIRKVVSEETIDVVFQKGLARKFFDLIGLVALKLKISELSDADAYKMSCSLFNK